MHLYTHTLTRCELSLSELELDNGDHKDFRSDGVELCLQLTEH